MNKLYLEPSYYLGCYKKKTAIMATVLLGTGFIALFFILMSVRLIFLKNGEFKGTCASQSPFLQNDGVTCSLCGKNPNDCDNKNESSNLADLPVIEKV